jgi:transposase
VGELGIFTGRIFMFYLGIDVAKAKLDCYLLTQLDPLKGKAKVVANTAKGLADLLVWLTKNHIPHDQLHVTMEATGVYHELATTLLHDAGACVSIANPAQVKHFGQGLAVRTKTDGVDSQVLARYCAMIKPAAWMPPPPEARILKGLLARREAILQDLLREKSRQEKAESTVTPELIHQSIHDSIAFLNAQLKKLQSQIDDHIDRHPGLKNDLNLLQTIPAIGPQSGTQLLAVMHTHQFNTAEQLSAYLGLVPVERQSGSSILGRAKLSKAGPAKVRAVLYMAAIVATKYNPHVKALFERLLARGKSKMSALGACMRKLVHLCFGVLKTQKKYQAEYQNA